MRSSAREQRSRRGRRLGIGVAIAIGVHALVIGGLVRLAVLGSEGPASLGLLTSAIEISSLDFPASLQDLPLPELERSEVVESVVPGAPPPITTSNIAEHDANPEREQRRPAAEGSTKSRPESASERSAGPSPRGSPGEAPSTAERESQASAHALRDVSPRSAGEPSSAPGAPPAVVTSTEAIAHALPSLNAEGKASSPGHGGETLMPPPAVVESTSAPASGHAPHSAGTPAIVHPTRTVAHALAPPTATGTVDAKAHPPVLVVGAGGEPQAPVEIVQGEVTAVRARSSELAEFLNVLREQVREQWNWRDAYAQSDPTGNSTAGMTTALRVRVRSDGNLEKVELVRQSGHGPFDDEAAAAVGRAGPFAPPPRDALDPQGGLTFRFEFNLDATLSRFVRLVLDQVNEHWRPSPAFRRAGDHERITVAQLMLSNDGVLNQVNMLSSAGIEFLDRDALKALVIGLRLPAPPAAYGHRGGLVPLTVEFHHNVRMASEVRVLTPGETPTAQ